VYVPNTMSEMHRAVTSVALPTKYLELHMTQTTSRYLSRAEIRRRIQAAPPTPKRRMPNVTRYEPALVTAGGKILCRRCAGTSRRTGLQCGAPAEAHSKKCRFHGSRATGPVTLAGLERCALARWHGKGESRSERVQARETSQTIRLLKELWILLESNPKGSELSTSPLVEAVLTRVAERACDSSSQGEPLYKKVRSSP
jgi:hypothetical protein